MWGAHQVDGRISAKNAVKIRAALQQSIDAGQVYEMYQSISPVVSVNNAQDRARARAWAIMNVKFYNEALRTALMRLFAEAWVTGEAAAGEAIYEEEALRKAGEIGVIDWSKWQPGDKATALLLKPTGAFKKILDRTGTTITGLDKTGYELVGNALADSIRAGYSPRKAAKLIQNTVGSPARALSIAVTESSRVMNSAAIDRYQEAGIDTMQWMAVQGGGTSVACEKCAENAGEKRKIGQPFTTGVLQPPQHPHCRCNLRPVVPDYDDMFDAQGNLLPLKPNELGVSDIMPKPPKKVYGGINEDELVEVYRTNKARNPLLRLTDNEPRGDEALKKAYDIKGYNELPKVLPLAEFEKVAATADAHVYRGIAAHHLSGKGLAEQWADAYTTGDHYAGFGVFGNGTYTSINVKTAQAYASRYPNSQGVVMDILLPDTSNFVKPNVLRDARKTVKAEIAQSITKLQNELFDATDAGLEASLKSQINELTGMSSVIDDDGILATLLGYDGIIINTDIALPDGTDELFYIILNRGKVVVKG